MMNNLVRREDYLFTYKVNFSEELYNFKVGMMIKTPTGLELGGAVSSSLTKSILFVDSGTRLHFGFKFKCLLTRRRVFLTPSIQGILDGTIIYLDRHIDVLAFRVQSDKDQVATPSVDFCIEPITHVNGMRLAQEKKIGP